MLANGIDGTSINKVVQSLNQAGAVVRLLASRLGSVTSADGIRFEIDATLENSPAVLFDAMVLPDGVDAVEALSKDGHSLEFLKDQYRHCKSILALGASSKLVKQAGISETLPSGDPDPGLMVTMLKGEGAATKRFIDAVSRHRHPQRDTDPPLI